MNKNRLQTYAYASIIIAAIATGAYIFTRRIFPALIPLLIAYLTAEAIRPAADFMYKYAKVPQKVTSLALIAVTVLMLGRFGTEALGNLRSDIADIASNLAQIAENRSFRLPSQIDKIVRKSGVDLDGLMYSALESTAGVAAEYSAKLAEAMLTRIPSLTFSVFTFVAALYYFCSDRDSLKRLVNLLPKAVKAPLRRLKASVGSTVKIYIKAYLLLMLINFAILSLGFRLIGIFPASTLALIISFADILPIIGVGTVLLPWACTALLFGNSFVGISLLALYCFIAFIRGLVEPRLIGKTAGIPPVISLSVSYAMFRLLGFWGMFSSSLALSISGNALRNFANEDSKK